MNHKQKLAAAAVLLTVACAFFRPAAAPAAVQHEPRLHPARGMLLVAAPQMRDPRFKRTVILLVEHSEEGSLGFIINKKTEVVVSDAFPELEEASGTAHVLFFGGPVQPSRVAYVYTGQRRQADHEVLGNLHWGSGDDEMRQLLTEKRPDSLRIFFGYAGWGPGQLDFELSLDDWQLHPASSELVFDPDTEHLWRLLNERKPGVMAALPGRVAAPRGGAL